MHHANDGTVALVLMAVLFFVVIAGSLFGAESRAQWRDVTRRPRFRATGSLRPSDWPRDDRDR
jgi:tryptophan-rich sensory protein